MRRAMLVPAICMLLAVAGPAGVAAQATAPPGETPPVKGSPIDHVIVVIQENRTFDNLFASSIINGGKGYPGADTTQVATIDGKQIPLRATPFEFPADPSHDHDSLLAEFNGGKMDGFVHDKIYPYPGFPPAPPNFALGYVPDEETLLYHRLAQRYALADENFSSRLVPTFPGHLFLITAQSQAANDPTDPVNWGCDSKPGTTVDIFTTGEEMQTPGVFPCFNNRTIGDLLDAAHVSWKYYTGALGNPVDAAVNVYDAIQHVRYGPDWDRNIVTPMANVIADIQNCKLPQVAYVTPTWHNSDHAGDLSNGGPAWIGSLYLHLEMSATSADSACRYYQNTAMIVTWDDSGGWYDHVAPPLGPGPGVTHYGFRVPIVVISAWSRSGYTAGAASFAPYVSHTQRETTSIVRFIEKNWALGNLGERDASGDDLSDMFDYARAEPVPPLPEFLAQQQIRRSHWSIAQSLHDTHPVDEDR